MPRFVEVSEASGLRILESSTTPARNGSDREKRGHDSHRPAGRGRSSAPTSDKRSASRGGRHGPGAFPAAGGSVTTFRFLKDEGFPYGGREGPAREPGEIPPRRAAQGRTGGDRRHPPSRRGA